jgi:hypothetical protein
MKLCIKGFAGSLLLSGIGFAGITDIEPLSYNEPEPFNWLADGKLFGGNSRFSIDLSSRTTFATESELWSFDHYLGFDLVKTFTSSSGDWGTLTAQVYLTKLNNQPRHPHFFEGDDDWELVTRITNFNYTGLFDGKLNFKVGHFEIPYGLEVPLNTNGTMHQVLTGKNLGVKADWGIGINGTLPAFKYEMTLSNGTGNELNLGADSYVVAGRIGSPDNQQTFSGTPGWGLSGFYGDVLGKNGITNRWRVGVDGSIFAGPLTLLGEVSVGQDENDNVVNGLVEVNWVNPSESIVLYTQLRSLNLDQAGGWDDAWSSTLGLRHAVNDRWAISAQAEHDWTRFGGAEEQTFFSFQARIRL